MKTTKQVVISEQDFREFPFLLVRELLEQSRKEWGVKFIRNEGGGEITEENELYGAFGRAIRKAFAIEE